jgi:hypothetical protein
MGGGWGYVFVVQDDEGISALRAWLVEKGAA